MIKLKTIKKLDIAERHEYEVAYIIYGIYIKSLKLSLARY